MIDKKNPLIIEDSKHFKGIIRTVIIILFILVSMLMLLQLYHYIVEINGMDELQKNNYMQQVIVYIVLFIIMRFTLLNKKSRHSMKIMKNVCSYKELCTLLKDEHFSKINNPMIYGVEESELWLNIQGTFVPKNFIVGGYKIDKMGEASILAFIIVNGSKVYYHTGEGVKRLEAALKFFDRVLPNVDLKKSSYFWFNGDKVRKQLKEKFKMYQQEGNSIEKLIYSYNSELVKDIYMFPMPSK